MFFSIKNKYYDETVKYEYKDYIIYDKKISKNKAISFQLSKFDPDNLFSIGLRFSWKGSDHAGPYFHIDVLGYFAIFNLYDIRHWNYDTNKWEIY